jgi:tetratricopeptide (TPR) repeat protein
MNNGALMVLVRTALWLVVYALLCGAPAFAEPTKAAKKEAFKLYAESEKRYREGRFEDAAALMRRAYELDPAPTLLFNLARALESAGDLEGAVEGYRNYLAKQPKARDRGAIEKRLATLEQQVKERAELARIREQEQVVEQKPEPPLLATTPPEQPKQQTVTTPVTVVPDRSTSPLPFVVIGMGATGVVTGGVLGFVAMSRRNAAEDEPDFNTARALEAKAHSFATGANIAYAAGGAVLTAGIVWLVLELSD